jgi:NTE family protein
VNARLARAAVLVAATAALGACASRPSNPPLGHYDPNYGYRAVNWQAERGDPRFGLVVAMSGGGTRAAALAYGVLEELHRTQVPTPAGPQPLLKQVKLVTGVSGGSFTALAYALYGERLFDEFETRFLKRDVQGALLARVLSPASWPLMAGGSYTRTELAADYYDEILFGGATYADLMARVDAPFVSVSGTEISTGSRLTFNQNTFDLICSDLSGMRLARAAAASSAVPVVFAPVTLDNYAGSCGFDYATKVESLLGEGVDRARLARAERRGLELRALTDSSRYRYLHVVDGGVADNLGLRTLLEGLEVAMASRRFREITGFDRLDRFGVIVVNSQSQPEVDWGTKEDPPGAISQLLKVTGISIDRYSYEEIALLRDYVRDLQADTPLVAAGSRVEFFPIEVSFAAITDPAERRFFLNLPTSFSLADEEVDRLREVGGRLLRESPEFQRLLADLEAPGGRSATR